jgi:hypothetical protein
MRFREAFSCASFDSTKADTLESHDVKMLLHLLSFTSSFSARFIESFPVNLEVMTVTFTHCWVYLWRRDVTEALKMLEIGGNLNGWRGYSEWFVEGSEKIVAGFEFL